MRHFVVVFGATTLAAAATLSGFFLGLAAGNALFGARSARWSRPLVVFGLLEIGVGVGALILPQVLAAYRHVHPVLYAHLAPHPAVFTAVKVVLAAAAVAVPTLCMGGTLPALAAAVAPAGQHVGRRLGRIYALQLLGATIGALAVPLLILPRLGAVAGYHAAVAASIATGIAAIMVGKRHAVGPAPRALAPPLRDLRVLWLAALSGAATLALQSLWTRMFALVHENSIYSFVVVLVVFLVGLAGGAAFAERALARVAPYRLLAWAWAVGGVLVIVSPRLFHRLTHGFDYLGSDGDGALLGRLAFLSAVILLPATIALGTALPVLMERAGGEGRVGAQVGRLLAVNTLGAIVGPLAATFVLAPRLGPWWSLALLGVVVALAATRAGLTPREQGVVLAAVALAVLWASPGRLPLVRLRPERGERLVAVREGGHGTTAVIEDAHDRWMTVNNSYVLGGTAETEEERFQAHLPLLLHPSPRRVAFLGLGTGITAGAALVHPVDRVVAVEIVPEVVASAREHFAQSNRGIVGDPRAEMIVDDARQFVAASGESFDVIVGDLLVPWRPAEAALYSRDHLEQVRRALAPGGIFCQWLPLYQLSEEQAAVLVRTFADVFPSATAWRGGFRPDAPTLALVGHAPDAPLDAGAIDERVRRRAPALGGESPFLQHSAGLWLFLVGPVRRDAAWLDGVRRHTDAQPWLELLHTWTSGRGIQGARASAFEERLAAESAEGTPLRTLDALHRDWMRRGAELTKASREGEAEILGVLRTLPPELQRALEVPDLQP